MFLVWFCLFSQMEGTDMVIRNFENFDPDVHRT
jgi:hypothetical protein